VPVGVGTVVDELEEKGSEPFGDEPGAHERPPKEPVPTGTDSWVHCAPKSVV
jgi:hypothetical protein